MGKEGKGGGREEMRERLEGREACDGEERHEACGEASGAARRACFKAFAGGRGLL